MREVRNKMIKEQLQAGTSVQYRSSGWSLWPRVHSNDLTTYDPVTSADQVREGDIVFCQVQPGDRFYAHVVKRKILQSYGPHHGEWEFTIANARGWENGTCHIKHIYGRLVECLH